MGEEHLVEHDPWDWDDWVSRVPDRVGGIMEILANRPEAVAWRAAQAARVTIDEDVGNMPDGLCWICAADQVLGPRWATSLVPTFRACRWCVRYDELQGARLGLVMLLPLLPFPEQPVRPGRTRPSDPQVVGALQQAWWQVESLDAWRTSVVRAVFARAAIPGSTILLSRWHEVMPPSGPRSRAAWWAYIDRHQPRLAAVLDALPPREGAGR